MTPYQFYKTASISDVKRIVEASGTTFLNFKQIAVSGGAVGRGLAERLAKASGGIMTELEILYPERYKSTPPNPQSPHVNDPPKP